MYKFCKIKIFESSKFSVRRNKSKADSNETGPIIIAHFFPELIRKSALHQAFVITTDKISCYWLLKPLHNALINRI